MTISATTQGLRPGVCTSTSRPSSPFDGMVIYETDTNRVLVWDNSAWVMIADTDSPPGLQLIKTQTIGTAVSSVVVSDAFSSDYENYLITVNGGVASTNTAIALTLGSAATGYYRWAIYGQFHTTTAFGLNTSNGVNWGDAAFGSASTIQGRFELFGPNMAMNTQFVGHSTQSRTQGFYLTQGGYLADTSQYTAFTLTPSTGGATLTGGTIRVYGYRNS